MFFNTYVHVVSRSPREPSVRLPVDQPAIRNKLLSKIASSSFFFSHPLIRHFVGLATSDTMSSGWSLGINFNESSCCVKYDISNAHRKMTGQSGFEQKDWRANVPNDECRDVFLAAWFTAFREQKTVHNLMLRRPAYGSYMKKD